MANFSGALKITDLNDFIAPSQDCIVIEGQSGTNIKLISDTNVRAIFLQDVLEVCRLSHRLRM